MIQSDDTRWKNERRKAISFEQMQLSIESQIFCNNFLISKSIRFSRNRFSDQMVKYYRFQRDEKLCRLVLFLCACARMSELRIFLFFFVFFFSFWFIYSFLLLRVPGNKVNVDQKKKRYKFIDKKTRLIKRWKLKFADGTSVRQKTHKKRWKANAEMKWERTKEMNEIRWEKSRWHKREFDEE